MKSFPSRPLALLRLSAFMVSTLGGIAIAAAILTGGPLDLSAITDPQPPPPAQAGDPSIVGVEDPPPEQATVLGSLWQPEGYVLYDEGAYRTLGANAIIVFDERGEWKATSGPSAGPGLVVIEDGNGWIREDFNILPLEETAPLQLVGNEDTVFVVGHDVFPGDMLTLAVPNSQEEGAYEISDTNYQWLELILYDDQDMVTVEEGWGSISISGSILSVESPDNRR